MKFLHKYHSLTPMTAILLLLIVSLSLFSLGLDATYKGTILRHFAMETFGGFIALAVAATAYNNFIGKKSIILPYIAAAFLATGIIDIFHATLSIDYFDVVVSSNAYFVPATWTASRTLLAILMFVGVLNYKLYRHTKVNPAMLLVSTLLLSFLLIYIMSTVELPAFILENSTVHRPWEIIPIIFFVLSLIVLHKFRATIPAVYYAYGFFILSIIVQLEMLFSLELYSPLFDSSHLLKIISYLYVAVPMFILLHRRAKKSLSINVGHTESRILLTVIAGVIILLNYYAHYITSEKKSLDNLQELRSAFCLKNNVFNAHENFPTAIRKKSGRVKKTLSYDLRTCEHNHYSMIYDEYGIDMNYQISFYRTLLDQIILAHNNNQTDRYRVLYLGLTQFVQAYISPELRNIVQNESETAMTGIVDDKKSMMLFIWVSLMGFLIASPFVYGYITRSLYIQFTPLRLLTDHIKSIYNTDTIRPFDSTDTFDEINTLKTSFNKMSASVNKSRDIAITAKETMEKKLDERTASLASTTDHLRRVVENVGDAIFTSNTKGEIESVNRAGLALFGYKLNELLGKNVKILQPEHIAVRHDDILKNYLKTGKGRLMGQDAIEATAKHKNGEIFPIEIAITETKKGNEHTFIALIKDITLRKQTEETLQKTKARMSRFLDSTHEGLLFHKDGIITDANRKGLEMLGLSMEAVQGHHLSEYLGESFRNHDINKDYELMLKYHDGHQHPIATTDRNIKIDNANYSVLSIRDMSDLEKARQESVQTSLELQNLIDTANAPIFGIDTEGRITEWNQSAQKLMQYTKEEVFGRDLVEDFITEDHKESVSKVLRSALKGKGSANYEVPLYTKDGAQRMILLNATPRRDTEGHVTGVISIGQDITEIDEVRDALKEERKSLELKVNERTKELKSSLVKLEDTNLQLEAINRHKSEFISSMSHELRTPLNGIIGSADLLHEQLFGTLNPKQLSYTEQIGKSADHLLSLINDILDMAKIDAGSMGIKIERMSIKEWLGSTVGIMQTEFRKKDIKVHTNISTSHDSIMADIRKCNQIMLNLLSNAVKYSAEGEHISICISDENGEHIKVEVEDSGIGINEGEFKRIFDEFYQVNRSRDEMLGGTGVGLALTKRLIEMHNGEIGVKNSEHGGALFFFTLPISHKEPQPSCDTHEIPSETNLLSLDISQQKRILIAEDNKVNASIILDMLNEFNYRTAVVENGQMALDMVQSCKPDIVLMDMKMPVMDGLEATQKIREIPEFDDLPIVAITANVTEESKKEQLLAGCTDHLSKPLKRKDLLRIISKYIGSDDKREKTL